MGGEAVRWSHTPSPGPSSYFGLGFDAEEDVGEKRLRPDGAVEGGHTSQEGPEHHQDVDVAAERSSSNQPSSFEPVQVRT